MKTFYTDGTGSQQTLNDSQTEKVVVYDTINDAEADLANLAEGQIIATKDDDFEGNAVPVNEVTLNNMHSVTSNAVASALAGATEVVETTTSNCNWVLVKIGNGKYIGFAWNKAKVIADNFTFTPPTGYSLTRAINVHAFKEGYADYPCRAMHRSANVNFYLYLENGEYDIDNIQGQFYCTKN